MPAKSLRLAFAGFVVLNFLLLSRSRYGQFPQAEGSLQNVYGSLLLKRSLHEVSNSSTSLIDPFISQKQCRPLSFPSADQCPHVVKHCPHPESILSVKYLERYFCTKPRWRPFGFVSLVLWLIFLFSTLGITASDFFTPNLATIAFLLGLDENVAGVTFLAFGNGSPDVFSTFSAMRANSGSLAIGELLGAASFIVSCVVGSMCIIKPFRVSPGPFLRDVGFFTVAVSLLLVILIDGRIEAWEAGVLVTLYVVYVVVVVLGSWWEHRQEWKRDQEALIRAEYQEEHIHEPYRDDPDRPSIAWPGISSVPSNRLQVRTDVQRRSTRNTTPISSLHHSAQLPSFSLVGALEFRQVIASLQQRASGPSLSMFESPVTPFAGGRYHAYPGSRDRTPHISLTGPEENPFDAALGLHRLHSPASPASPVSPDQEEQQPPRLLILATDTFNSSPSSMPSILRSPPSPTGSEGSQSRIINHPSRRRRALSALAHTAYILFPSLHHFKEQSLIAKIASVFATPAILCLTLTLPVVVTPRIPDGLSHDKMANVNADPRLVDFEEEGIERVLIAEEEVLDDLHEMEYNKWLVATQCVLGPLFCVTVLAQGLRHQAMLLAAAAAGGSVAAILVVLFSEKEQSPLAKMVRCSIGFFVAIVWIMAIADEVVNVLQTFGFIFGLSDAIIGLTIFAMGNSLADLVANTSVAAFAPIMGFSACFGSPMLNILLGVGFSGSFIIHNTSAPYDITFSTTLFVSAVGLLILLAATLIFVPMNNYLLTRRWGIFLVSAYVVLMLINVAVELRHEPSR